MVVGCPWEFVPVESMTIGVVGFTSTDGTRLVVPCKIDEGSAEREVGELPGITITGIMVGPLGPELVIEDVMGTKTAGVKGVTATDDPAIGLAGVLERGTPPKMGPTGELEIGREIFAGKVADVTLAVMLGVVIFPTNVGPVTFAVSVGVVLLATRVVPT